MTDIMYLQGGEYDNTTGRKLIGLIRDDIYSEDDDYLQYDGNATNSGSYGNIYLHSEKLLPFARIESNLIKGSYEFTLSVRSSKLSSPEVKRLNMLSIKAGGGSIFSKKRKKKVKRFL